MKTAYYTRVSTTKQSFERVNLEQKRKKYDILCLDKCSGKIPFAKRPKAKELLQLCQQGQIKSIDFEDISRLGRSTKNVLETLELFESIDIEVSIGKIGNITPYDDDGRKNVCYKLIVSILGAISELEREIIVERTREGLEAYKRKGGKLGRPKQDPIPIEVYIKSKEAKKIKRYLNKEYSIKDTSEKCSVGIKKVYEVMKYYNINRGGKRTEKAK